MWKAEHASLMHRLKYLTKDIFQKTVSQIHVLGRTTVTAEQMKKVVVEQEYAKQHDLCYES